MFDTLYRPEHNGCHGQRPRRVACAADLPPDLIGVVDACCAGPVVPRLSLRREMPR